MSVSSKKGSRTRYMNLIEKEVEKKRSLLAEAEAKKDDVSELRKKVATLKILIGNYLSKFERALDELAEFVDSIVEDTERKKEEKVMASFDEEDTDIIAMATEAMAQLTVAEDSTGMKKASTSKEKSTSVSLPKLSIAKFSGDIMQYQEFWDHFETSIHKNENLSDVEKMTYLKSLLTGEALDAIAGLTISNANYEVAVKLLCERFGDTQVLINAHYVNLIELPVSTNQTAKLRQPLDNIERHLRSLEVLKQDVNQSVFVSIIMSKLPKACLVTIEIQKEKDEKWTVKSLRESLDNFISAREVAERNQNDGSTGRVKPNEHQYQRSNFKFTNYQKRQHTPSATLAATGAIGGYSPRCFYCTDSHWSDECTKFSTIEGRKKKLKAVCHICLKKGHRKDRCRPMVNRLCAHCGVRKDHHRSICPNLFTSASGSVAESIQSSSLRGAEAESGMLTMNFSMVATGVGRPLVCMQTATVSMMNPVTKNKVDGRLVFDTGSYRTYMSSLKAKSLKLSWYAIEYIPVNTFGSNTPKYLNGKLSYLQIRLNDGSLMTLHITIIPMITGKLHQNPVRPETIERIEVILSDQEMSLADTLPKTQKTFEVDLLVGNDYYLNLVQQRKIQVEENLFLVESKLGWLLTGRSVSESAIDVKQNPGMLILTYAEEEVANLHSYTKADMALAATNPHVERLWDLDAIGITEEIKISSDDKSLEKFQANFKF
ncbi:uncharacterized protein LOC141898948 [Tubulanus polymorphus]|uniref:uncharacterized protein LOC141898948 n=1 Tax=Tubulanus polymorphus TaxID=672921 RepID=UPI003DA27109